MGWGQWQESGAEHKMGCQAKTGKKGFQRWQEQPWVSQDSDVGGRENPNHFQDKGACHPREPRLLQHPTKH